MDREDVIVFPALGRQVSIGDLYNYSTGVITQRNTWDTCK